MESKLIVILSALIISLLGSCVNQSNIENSNIAENNFDLQRSKFKTNLISNSFISDGEIPLPPDSIFRIIKYKSEVGNLDAYITNPIDTNQRYPVIIWAHGGFGGIGEWFWEYDSYIESFFKNEVVVVCPSWRGENKNPGKFELFYGEVNDLSNCINYISTLKYINPERIYLAGHSTGGTLAMLTSLTNKKIRATFSFGGAPDIKAVVEDGEGYGNTPFDYENPRESELRSATNFVNDIKNPIFYFEGEESFYPQHAKEMQFKAEKLNKPFKSFIIPNKDHFNIVKPINELILNKILQDTSSIMNIGFTLNEIQNKMEDQKVM